MEDIDIVVIDSDEESDGMVALGDLSWENSPAVFDVNDFEDESCDDDDDSKISIESKSDNVIVAGNDDRMVLSDQESDAGDLENDTHHDFDDVDTSSHLMEKSQTFHLDKSSVSENFYNGNKYPGAEKRATNSGDTATASKSELKCPDCFETFLDIVAYEMHLLVHDEKDVYICHICDQLFTRKAKYLSHLRNHIECTAADDEHNRITSSSASQQLPNYVCGVCNYKVTNRKTFRKHVMKHTEVEIKNSKKNYNGSMQSNWCKFCDRFFHSKMHYTMHMSLHFPTSDKTNSLECNICFRKFKNAGIKAVHMKNHSKCIRRKSASREETIKCKFCPKCFPNKKLRGAHCMAKHKSNYWCHICRRKFSSYSNRDRHMIAHNQNLQSKLVNAVQKNDSNNKMISPIAPECVIPKNSTCCKLCKRHIVGLSNFKRHTEKHKRNGDMDTSDNGIDNDNFPCKKCPAVFKSADWLHRHVQKHGVGYQSVGGDKDVVSQRSFSTNNMKCPICSQNFRSLLCLRSHMDVHDVPKENPDGKSITPFLLPQLSKSKIRSSAKYVVDHSSNDVTEKMFGCRICGRKFFSPSHLERHINIHRKKVGMVMSKAEKPKSSDCNDTSIDLTSGKPTINVDKLKKVQVITTINDNDGRKTFSCGNCSKAFANKYNLLRHDFFVHKQLNDRAFKSKSNCKTSGKAVVDDCQKQSIHSQHDNPLMCRICHKTFTEARTVRLHEQNFHMLSKKN